MNEKVYRIIFGIMLVTILVFFTGFTVQTCRLQSSMEQLEHYRTELESASNRQSDITSIVERTGEILSTTTNSVADLRKQIQEIEDCYNQLWQYCRDIDGTTNYSDEEELK